MSLLKQTQALCQLYNIYPQKSKGQNFLINQDIYQEIVSLAEIEESEVLEIGPGLGFLSHQLAKVAKKVVAVELDEKLVNYLVSNFSADNLQVIHQDILKFNPKDYFSKKTSYNIVANLPYNITSIFLRNFLSSDFPPKSLFLMLQKEVAERIIAKPPKMNLLALSVQYYGQAEVMKIVKAENFWPKPAVDSALIRIKYIKPKQTDLDKKIFSLAKIGFSAKRKMLKNNLAKALKIDESVIKKALIRDNLREDARAQNLSVADWKNLTKIIC
jgi:16S rRNA (adenine1518-N6/adenine1519-N6)-dimethyltransferase